MALYKPGQEPEKLAKRVQSFLAKIDEYYPDSRIEGLHNAHKHLGERLTKLYRELGYNSGEEMMRAYGYEYVQKIDRRDKGTRIEELITELQQRYPNGSGFDSVLELKNANPDLSGQMTSLQIKKETYIEAGILSTPVAPVISVEEYEKCCDALLALIRKKFPNGPQWINQSGLTDALPEARQTIAEIRELTKKVTGCSFIEEMKKRRIFADRDALVAKQKAQKEVKGTKVAYFQRKCLVGESERSFSGLTRNAFGMPFSDYINCRKRTEPCGTIGSAMRDLKKLIPELDRIADVEGLIQEDALSSHIKKLSKISDQLGYADIVALLRAYGYTIISAQNHDVTDDESIGDSELDNSADKVEEEISNSHADQTLSAIKKEDSRLVFDNAFSIELPSGIEFYPETDVRYAALSGFCKNNDDDDNSIELMIHPLDANTTGALKAYLEKEVSENECECYYLMLFEDKNTEVAVFIQASASMLEMECNIAPMLRIGEHSYCFQAEYGRSGFALAPALKQDIRGFCSIFDNIKIKNSKKSIKTMIDSNKLNKIVEKIFGIDKEAASALGEHCSEDTPAIVRDDWVITVPAGYMYSTDEEIVGHRPIVLGLDDGTLDLSAPFDSTVNFSVIMPNEEDFSGEPLDSPSMENIVYNTIYPFGGAFGKGYPTIRKDRDMVITYYEHFGFEDDDGRTVYKYMGTILTRQNIYAFQYFDKNVQSQEEAELALKELLYSVKTKDEYESEQQVLAENAARVSELNDQLQSLTSQMQSGFSDMQAFVEREKFRLEEEERKKEELEKKKQAAKANRDADEESVLMYITLIIEAANKQDRSDDDFYSCYEEDFPALDKNGLSQLRRKIKAEMQIDPKCYEEAVCALPYDKRYYYSANNMCNTHDYSGDPNEDVESLIMDTVSRWFESSELSQVRSGIKQLIDDERTNLDEALSSVNEDWKNFYLAKDSLYIGLLDDTSETYDPNNKLMVQYGNVIGVVQLATSGFFRMSTKLMNYFPVYWNVTLEEIWNAAKENGIYDQRDSNGDGQEEGIAQAVYDKAIQNLGIKTATSSYSSRSSEPAYTRSNYDYSPSTPVANISSDTSPKKKEGCYIATAVYGSYDAPEVMTLRHFRDETLKNSFFGQLFIKVYYTLSPPIAEKLKNAHRVNKVVRSILDKWVARLNSK